MNDASDFVSDCPHCDPHSFALKHPLYETENFKVVCDVHPLIEGHLLIIPKKHISCIGEFSDGLFREFLQLYRKFSRFIKDTYRAVGSFEHGKIGQTVFHAHFHILPFRGDPSLIVPEGPKKFQNIQDISLVQDIYQKENGYLFFSIGDTAYIVDPSLGAPRFFRDRFATALSVPERGNWQDMRQNIALIQTVHQEIYALKDKWHKYAN